MYNLEEHLGCSVLFLLYTTFPETAAHSETIMIVTILFFRVQKQFLGTLSQSRRLVMLFLIYHSGYYKFFSLGNLLSPQDVLSISLKTEQKIKANLALKARI